MTVPEGWTIEPIYNAGVYFLVRTPSGLMATIDLKARGFRSGLVITGRMQSTRRYAGRGWKQALCDDAVHHLKDVDK